MTEEHETLNDHTPSSGNPVEDMTDIPLVEDFPREAKKQLVEDFKLAHPVSIKRWTGTDDELFRLIHYSLFKGKTIGENSATVWLTQITQQRIDKLSKEIKNCSRTIASVWTCGVETNCSLCVSRITKRQEVRDIRRRLLGNQTDEGGNGE